MKTKLTVGSLFAGIGGIELGLERTGGFETRWQVENNSFANKVLAKHWPSVRRCEDVRTFPPQPIEEWEVDVITGGFPCQDISNAGSRGGIVGRRSGLWGEYWRIICELQPRYVLIENVAALLDRGFETILGGLADLGYDAEWELFSACSVGAPHTRKRLFIVAYPHGNGLQGVFRRVAQEQWETLVSSGCDTSERREWEQLPSPVFCRSSDGIPHRMDRTRCLGNAVVPQVATLIGRMILNHARNAAND